MAIKKFKDYGETKSYGEFPSLPKGGYVLKILGASVHGNSFGEYIKISCDIAEGYYSGFFENDYKNQDAEDKKWRCNFLLNVPNDDGTERDGWTKRKFKTVIEALEDSNTQYHFDWDEQKFKGLLVGGLFNLREYEKRNGEIGQAVNLAQLCAVERIRTGKYKLPEDKLFNRPRGPKTDSSGFMSVPEGEENELPF